MIETMRCNTVLVDKRPWYIVSVFKSHALKPKVSFMFADAVAPTLSSISHQSIMTEFALSLLHRAVKKGHVNPKSPEMISRLDALLPEIVSAMKSRQSGVVEYALRIMSQLVQAPLPGTLQLSYLFTPTV